MNSRRLVLGSAGTILGLFGVFRLVTDVRVSDLLVLGIWLVAAVVIHDGIIAPTVVALGWGIARIIPARGRRYLQGALIVGALVTVIVPPMMYREDSQPVSKAILLQDYGTNAAILVAAVAAVALLGYARRVAADKRAAAPGRAGTRPAGGRSG